MDTVQITWGSQSFAGSSTKCHLFRLKARGSEREFLSKTLTQVGASRVVAASRDGYADHGKWHSETLQSEESALVLVQASMTRNGLPYANGAYVLALRSDAALVKVNLKPAWAALAVYDVAVPVFTGRADVLDVGAWADYGVTLDTRYAANYTDPEELGELFSIAEVAPGQPRPELRQVVTPSGEARLMAVPAEPRRRLRVRARRPV